MDDIRRAKNYILPVLTEAENMLQSAVKTDNIEYKFDKYIEISNALGSILSNYGAYNNKIRNKSGGKFNRVTMMNLINESIVDAYNRIYIPNVVQENYDIGLDIRTIIPSEIESTNREVSQQQCLLEELQLPKTDPGFGYNYQPALSEVNGASNAIEMAILELCDRIRCDIRKSKNLSY